MLSAAGVISQTKSHRPLQVCGFSLFLSLCVGYRSVFPAGQRVQHILKPVAAADVRKPRKDLVPREIPRFKLRIRQRIQRAVEAERRRQPGAEQPRRPAQGADRRFPAARSSACAGRDCTVDCCARCGRGTSGVCACIQIMKAAIGIINNKKRGCPAKRAAPLSYWLG